jgi:hypothetical protein
LESKTISALKEIKMKKIKFVLNTGFYGCAHEEIVEFDDDITEEELWDYYNEWKEEQVEGYWEEIQN